MINLQPNEYLIIVAMFGALIYMLSGWLEKRQETPDTKLKPAYVVKTLIAMALAGLVFEQIKIVRLTLGALLFAFLSGMGGNRAISKGSKIK